uniref:Nucleotide-sugar transporter n=1 Tax=Pyrodinium bahamense TaxID=73915 RepID=A0A7S0FN86_9DINO
MAVAAVSPALTFGLAGLLAVQFAAQPLLMRSFMLPAVVVSSVVMVGEAMKLAVCLLMLVLAGRLSPAMEGWTPAAGLQEAALPSLAYALQSMFNTTAYRRLDGVTFNVLNQTKLLFTAFFVLVLRGRWQTRQQCLALLLIFAASVLATVGDAGVGRHCRCVDTTSDEDCFNSDLVGIAAAVAGAMLSGLGAVLSEVVLVQQKRDALLFSAELAVGGMAAVGLNLLLDLNGDGSRWSASGLFALWTPATLLPVTTNALSGILVGVLSKALGSVRKAFVITVGLLLSAALRVVSEGQLPSNSLCGGMVLVIAGVRLYCAQPTCEEPPAIGPPRAGAARSHGKASHSKASAQARSALTDPCSWVEAYAAPAAAGLKQQALGWGCGRLFPAPQRGPPEASARVPVGRRLAGGKARGAWCAEALHVLELPAAAA